MPSTSSFYNIINDVYDSASNSLRMSLNFTHTHSSGSGGQLDWDVIWSDAVHSHGTDTEGGQLDHGSAFTSASLLDDDHPQYQKENLFTTAGDVAYASGSSTWARLAIGTTVGQSLTVGSGGTAPAWGNPTLYTTQFSGSGNGRVADLTIYQNTGSNAKIVSIGTTPTTNGVIVAYCDSNGTPTTPVGRTGSTNSGAVEIGSITFIVLPNYYYRVGGTANTLNEWTEWS